MRMDWLCAEAGAILLLHLCDELTAGTLHAMEHDPKMCTNPRQCLFLIMQASTSMRSKRVGAQLNVPYPALVA